MKRIISDMKRNGYIALKLYGGDSENFAIAIASPSSPLKCLHPGYTAL